MNAEGATLTLLERCGELYPLSLHGVGLSLGSSDGVNASYLSQLSSLADRTNPWLISDHASVAPPFTPEALDLLCANVQRVQDQLKRTIAVENVSVNTTGADLPVAEPEFLTQLVRRTGCTLLIDLNSVYVNALNAFRLDIRRRLNSLDAQDQAFPLTALDRCRQWIDGIPAEAVAELHVAGHDDCGNVVINNRSRAITDPVWSLYSYTVRRWGPRPTLIEWDIDIPPLQVLLDEAAHANTLTRDALNPCANAVTLPSANACRACFQACR